MIVQMIQDATVGRQDGRDSMAGMAEPISFPIRFSSANGVLFRALVIPPSASYVDLTDDTIHVRLGWAFSTRIPRRLVTSAKPGKRPKIPLTAGAHGWNGRWLVNAAPDGIVAVELSEPVRAFTAGFPVRLKVLAVSLEDPDAFLTALGAPAA